jgi:hypothetical protein
MNETLDRGNAFEAGRGLGHFTLGFTRAGADAEKLVTDLAKIEPLMQAPTGRAFGVAGGGRMEPAGFGGEALGAGQRVPTSFESRLAGPSLNVG